MSPRTIINWLIALSVAAGLLAAPLSGPAMAVPRPMAVADEMQAMGLMPCCPDQHMPCCQDKAKDSGFCPCIALCMLTITLPAPEGAGAAVLVDRAFSRSAFALPDDLLIDGLGQYPPDHPPRTIV